VIRGRSVEAEHRATIAVVDENGELTHSFGDPNRSFSLRSSTKPLQALPLVTSGVADELGLGNDELAIACASHNGTDQHVDVVRRLLARAGVGAEALKCGTHLPIGLRLRHERAMHGEDRDPIRHNCSGKHAGFLLLAKRLGDAPEAYLDPRSRTQTLVHETVARACDLDENALAMAIDGCSAPTFAFPLVALARGFANLARARSRDQAVARAFTRIRDAMLAEPLLVSGEGRFDCDLARSFPDNVVDKGGAEAIVAIGFRDPPLALVVKVDDGAERALAPVVVAVLRELGMVSDIARFPLLARHERPSVRNHAGLVTGEIVAKVTLDRAS
jgi:L-asparaginase II